MDQKRINEYLFRFKNSLQTKIFFELSNNLYDRYEEDIDNISDNLTEDEIKKNLIELWKLDLRFFIIVSDEMGIFFRENSINMLKDIIEYGCKNLNITDTEFKSIFPEFLEGLNIELE